MQKALEGICTSYPLTISSNETPPAPPLHLSPCWLLVLSLSLCHGMNAQCTIDEIIEAEKQCKHEWVQSNMRRVEQCKYCPTVRTSFNSTCACGYKGLLCPIHDMPKTITTAASTHPSPSFTQMIATLNPPEPTKEEERWSKQARAVFEVMKSGAWMTKPEISFHSGATEHAVSARLSDLKKKGYPSEKRRAAEGISYQYRLIV